MTQSDTTPAVSYRPSTASDAVACARIICDWGKQTWWMVPINNVEDVAASWAELLDTKTSWVALAGHDVVGFCVREDDTITGLYVETSARGQGVGRALLDLAKRDCDEITVWVYELNKRAVAFYAREKFLRVGREKDEHSDLIYLETRWRRPE